MHDCNVYIAGHYNLSQIISAGIQSGKFYHVITGLIITLYPAFLFEDIELSCLVNDDSILSNKCLPVNV